MTSPPSDLEKLLRLKRYEQPPAGYFEDFVSELHKRQRRELLRVPVGQLLVDRLAAALHQFDFLRRPSWLYSMSASAAAVLAVMWAFATPPRQPALTNAEDASSGRGSVSTVGVNPERTTNAPRRSAATVTVSQEDALPEQPNGLRRTPTEDFSALVPVAHPDASPEPGSHATPRSQVIILVR